MFKPNKNALLYDFENYRKASLKFIIKVQLSPEKNLVTIQELGLTTESVVFIRNFQNNLDALIHYKSLVANISTNPYFSICQENISQIDPYTVFEAKGKVYDECKNV